MTLFLGPLSPHTTSGEIEAFFSPLSVSVDLKTDPTTGRSRRFALIEADAAALAYSGQELGGRAVTVKEME